MLKRLLIVFIVFALVLTFMPLCTIAEADNIVANGDFENINTTYNLPIGWYEYWGKNQWQKDGALLTLVETDAASGTYSVKISAGGYITQRISGHTPGAYYKVSAMIKSTTGSITCKTEFRENGQEVSRKYTNASGSTGGQWKTYVSEEFCVDEEGLDTLFYVIASGGDVLVDSICYYKVRDPDRIKLTTDKAIYYAEDTGYGTATAEITDYYSDYDGTRTKFRLYDGIKILYEKTVYGKNDLKFEFPLTYLTLKKHEYMVTATIYNRTSGEELERDYCRIFKYDRPSGINSTNNFVVDKKIYHPVIAMGLGGDVTTLATLAEAGINTVFCSASMLDACQSYGLKGIVFLYSNMKPAGHPDNINSTISIINQYKDHPALLGWSVMDEPFGNDDRLKEYILDSYTCIRNIDDKTPIVIVEAALKKEYVYMAAKYCDVVSVDPYPNGTHPIASYVAEYIHYAQDAVKRDKPVFATLQTFLWGSNYYPSGSDLRSGIYQSFFEGAQGMAYYCYKNSYGTTSLNQMPLWNDMKAFAANEQALLFEHFVDRATVPFSDYRGQDDVWYHSFVKDGNIYLAVINRNGASGRSVTIPMSDYKRGIKINSFTAEVIAGTNAANTVNSGNNLYVDLEPNCAILYKITPGEGIDFSSLSWAEFESVTDYNAPYNTSEEENFLQNGSFEIGTLGSVPVGWDADNLTSFSSTGHGVKSRFEMFKGNYSAELTFGGGIKQSRALEAGTYRLSFKYKGSRPSVSVAGGSWSTSEAAGMARVCNDAATVWDDIKYTPWAEQSTMFTVSGGTYSIRITHQDSWQNGSIPMYLDDVKLTKVTGFDIGVYNKYSYGTYNSFEPVILLRYSNVADSKKINAAASLCVKAEGVTSDNVILYVAQYTENGKELTGISVTNIENVSTPQSFTDDIKVLDRTVIIKVFLWRQDLIPNTITLKITQ